MSAKQDFDIFLATNKNLKILDIGGRDRSKVDRSKFYGSNHDVSVIDIIDGDNVDIVGDAHSLSSYFPVNTFDVLVSTSVFEHLHSPWKAAVEMNKILKMGGIALVQTHQTLGMHDIPWDFWRFSDQAWKAIFNSKTGYEILKTNMTHESFILPFLFRRDKVDAEKSAGFELSTVLVRKIGESILDWDVNTSEISNQNYPMTEDGFNPDEMEIVFK
jgi:SAM-dependent methyltransferase